MHQSFIQKSNSENNSRDKSNYVMVLYMQDFEDSQKDK